MSEDHRCCGSGTCIINDEGWCWCGQRWVGDQLCQPNSNEQSPSIGDTGEEVKDA